MSGSGFSGANVGRMGLPVAGEGGQCVTLGEAMRDEVGFVCRVMESELYGKGRDYGDCMQYAQNAMEHGSPVTAQLFVNQANDAQAAIDGMVDGLV